jgi:predicted DNA-binding protein (MmcQ/YjbR family)
MDADRMRAMLLKLPHVAETVAWSTYVLFWAADKSIGGKLFAMMNPVNETNGVITYAAGPKRYAELLEREGVSPSVEFPRSQWVQIERWDLFRHAEWQSEMEAAHAIISAKLPKRTRDVLALPARERKRVIAERTALPAGRAPKNSSLR